MRPGWKIRRIGNHFIDTPVDRMPKQPEPGRPYSKREFFWWGWLIGLATGSFCVLGYQAVLVMLK